MLSSLVFADGYLSVKKIKPTTFLIKWKLTSIETLSNDYFLLKILEKSTGKYIYEKKIDGAYKWGSIVYGSTYSLPDNDDADGDDQEKYVVQVFFRNTVVAENILN